MNPPKRLPSCKKKIKYLEIIIALIDQFLCYLTLATSTAPTCIPVSSMELPRGFDLLPILGFIYAIVAGGWHQHALPPKEGLDMRGTIIQHHNQLILRT